MPFKKIQKVSAESLPTLKEKKVEEECSKRGYFQVGDDITR